MTKRFFAALAERLLEVERLLERVKLSNSTFHSH